MKCDRVWLQMVFGHCASLPCCVSLLVINGAAQVCLTLYTNGRMLGVELFLFSPRDFAGHLVQNSSVTFTATALEGPRCLDCLAHPRLQGALLGVLCR
jgi:hypothetical protein